MPPQRHSPSSTSGKVRQRSQRACGPCRKRKIKCDGKEPCEACTGYGYDCVYSERQPHKPRGSTVAAGSPVKNDAFTASEIAADAAGVSDILEAKVDGPYVTTESLVTESAGDSLLIQSLKTRFTSAYSAIGWPKTLGVSLGMPDPPRLQSFGWNPGTRAEPQVQPETNICNIISMEEMTHYSDIYFKTVHPFFGILERDMYLSRSPDFWISQKRGADFEAVMCGVVALGSYFSGSSPCKAESQLVEHGRLLLDLSVAHPPSLLSVKHVVAWVLRTIYLRSTTRPHICWMASCTSVHIAEALGLHRDINESQMKRDVPRIVSASEVDLRRKIFWVATSLNQFLASEYGRTRVHIELIGLEPALPKGNDLTSQTIAILQSVPGQQGMLGRGSDLLEALQHAMALPVKSPFLGLLRADACFCTFRMLRSTNLSLSAAQISSFLEAIKVGLDAVKFLISLKNPWWNVVGTPFHTVCVLLSLGTLECLALIPAAMETLKNAAAAFDSHLSREALRTARALVQAAVEKRRKELESLDRGLSIIGNVSQGSPSPSASANFEWSMDNNFGMPDFLDLGGYYGFENEGFHQPPLEAYASIQP